MIRKTQAIVLRTINYGDQSKIVTFFTRSFGKLTGLVKGYRNPKGKFASVLEIGNDLDLVLYKKDTREVQLITEAVLRAPMLGATSSLEQLSALHQTLELIRLTTENDDAHLGVFELLHATLQKINVSRKNHISFFFYFQVQLISLLGFRLNFQKCVLTGKSLSEKALPKDARVVLLAEHGGFALQLAAEERGFAGMPVSTDAFKAVQWLSLVAIESVENLFLEKLVINEIFQLLDSYFRFHIDDLPAFRSREIFNQLVF
ncbi:DNA repair protein RecO [Chloroherpeton thalassium ATCC 35110]|uniref:DNA repair protein RecO n=1 Tax=Chloroherpeton thalassium (strain ATCC 35110 / GB-78) TaxID=517418 RepID=RECO_CHLT3|nr:DNA repair protein RecO [Chloroherpeton thalassium]B3QU22.1 RecName: Full=DNA repair protein RecO; AltName: Full=Recombination protein O [Chloroherpeton thalassium ATCC 35110]ACF12820.1 DNA repair protein RecO [Chloroherpeton thalassium ATCC 35110]